MLYVFSNDVIFWTRHKPISKCKVTNNSLNNCDFQAKTLIGHAFGMFQWQSAISNTQQRVTQQHITQQRVTQHAEDMSLRDDDFLIGFNWVLMD